MVFIDSIPESFIQVPCCVAKPLLHTKQIPLSQTLQFFSLHPPSTRTYSSEHFLQIKKSSSWQPYIMHEPPLSLKCVWQSVQIPL
jgi:hypothetical protein